MKGLRRACLSVAGGMEGGPQKEIIISGTQKSPVQFDIMAPVMTQQATTKHVWTSDLIKRNFSFVGRVKTVTVVGLMCVRVLTC